MIYLTQLVYIKQGEEKTFLQFEDVALPLIPKYNGQLMLRIRPKESEIVERSIDTPYEIHLIQFPADSDFENFMNDPEREKFLHLKKQSVRSVMLIKGSLL